MKRFGPYAPLEKQLGLTVFDLKPYAHCGLPHLTSGGKELINQFVAFRYDGMFRIMSGCRQSRHA